MNPVDELIENRLALGLAVGLTECHIVVTGVQRCEEHWTFDTTAGRFEVPRVVIAQMESGKVLQVMVENRRYWVKPAQLRPLRRRAKAGVR